MFSWIFFNQPFCPHVCVQNTSFCQSPGWGINSHLVTALVITKFILSSGNALKLVNSKIESFGKDLIMDP